MKGKINRKELEKQVEDAYKGQKRMLKDSLREACDILRSELGYKSPSDAAVAFVATSIFSMKLSKQQSLSRIDQLIKMEKMKRIMEQKQGIMGHKDSGCKGCQHEHPK